MPSAIADYEEVDVDPTATTVEVVVTADVIQLRVQYSALSRTELTHPRTDYEIINSTSTEAFVVNQQHTPEDVGEQPLVEYANITRW